MYNFLSFLNECLVFKPTEAGRPPDFIFLYRRLGESTCTSGVCDVRQQGESLQLPQHTALSEVRHHAWPSLFFSRIVEGEDEHGE